MSYYRTQLYLFLGHRDRFRVGSHDPITRASLRWISP